MKLFANGIDIRYEVSGNDPSKPWVTLAHALACDLAMWDELAAALAPHFNVLRYDTRGHGGSSVGSAPALAAFAAPTGGAAALGTARREAPAGSYTFEQLAGDVVSLLDALNIVRTHFVGLSMGGMIAQHLALLAPNRIDRLVIASSTSRMPPAAAPLWEARLAKAREQGMAALADETLGRWFTAGFAARRPEVLAGIAAGIAATPVAGYVGCAEAIRRLDITERIAAIHRPTLVIVGADDPGTPPAMSEVIARHVAGAKLEVIPVASHLCCIEQAEVFNRLVTDFLD